MRRGVFALLASALLVRIAAPQPADDFALRLAAFHVPYNKLTRTFWGCPEGAHEIEECKPGTGMIDRKEFEHARRAAMKLFDLAERK